jgi:ABC-2 type transport system permease protein
MAQRARNGLHRRPGGLGLRSIFGKTLRDSRAPMLVVGGLLVAMILAGGDVMATTYGSLATRAELGAMSREIPPALRGIYGDPVAVDTLGGFVSWHYGGYFALVAGLWSILALSATLAAEARRGSLELALVTARSRRSVAYQKVGGHVAAMVIVMAVVGAAAWFAGAAFGTVPGDAVPVDAAASFALGLIARALVAGSIAFALASLLGRGAAAGIAGIVMLGGYVIHGYRTVIPAFEAVDGLTWWSWLGGHVPLAGQVDWGGVGLTAAVAIVLLLVGVEIFVRRDVGVTGSLPTPAAPAILLGVRGPVGRALGDLLPAAAWWAIGLGIYGVVMAVAARSLIDLLGSSPGLAEIFRTLLPGIDLTTASGFLQLGFVDFGFVLFGLAASTFVAARWSDETSGRLEVLLASPLARSRWALSAGLATWLATAVVTAVLAASIAVGVGSTGEDPWTAATGVLVLGLYGGALAGIGMAVGGLFGASTAAPIVAAVAVGTFLLDTLAPILRLPDWVAQLALTTHLGQPMIGELDAAGMTACAMLAVAGLAVGAWGMSRRDVVD